MNLCTIHYCPLDLKPRSIARRKFTNDISISNVIYLFYKDDECLYIGETSVSLANRIYVNTPKERNSPWYKEGNTIHLIQLDESIDDIARQSLEAAFILAYKPKYNKKA